MPVPINPRDEMLPTTGLDNKLAELQLLGHSSPDDLTHGAHETKTAPVLTRDAYAMSRLHEDIPQYGVLGEILEVQNYKNSEASLDDRRLYLNTNAPLSAIVCGVQGSGKSHTVSVMLENMLVANYPATGEIVNPLSGLVFHFGETGSAARPCEAAFVGTSSSPDVDVPPVRVYVSPSSLKRMKRLYAPLGNNVTVEPLFFAESELDAAAFLSMMAVGSSESAPLYMQTVLSILRGLGEEYTYATFMKRLEAKKTSLNPQQLSSLQQRMELLQSFLQPKSHQGRTSAARFAPGQITIIDLSDPFVDPPNACGLFEIVLRLFERADVGTGKVLVVDEAHKYLSQTRSSTGLTSSLLSLIRQQRHMSMRVVISTQEPTVIPPVFIDLCGLVILHRFSSSAWWDHLGKHVSSDLTGEDTFNKVVQLKTGEAIVLAPSGIGLFASLPEKGLEGSVSERDQYGVPSLGQFGRRYMLIRTRQRITQDGGVSLLAVDVEP
ncbi:hypothetical protein DENSPDRAFT_790755 [Dentipellis sp. KUC8613]|nr:hypothetical protein DENSPDRAFT_790755 [Dentipellis sp. KUC8613]